MRNPRPYAGSLGEPPFGSTKMLNTTRNAIWHTEKTSPKRVLIRATSGPRLGEWASGAGRLTVVVVTGVPSMEGPSGPLADGRTLGITGTPPHRPVGGLSAPPTTRSALSPWADDRALSARLPSLRGPCLSAPAHQPCRRRARGRVHAGRARPGPAVPHRRTVAGCAVRHRDDAAARVAPYVPGRSRRCLERAVARADRWVPDLRLRRRDAAVLCVGGLRPAAHRRCVGRWLERHGRGGRHAARSGGAR